MTVEATPPSFAESSDKFRQDDLEFRTITTLLYLLDTHDEPGPDITPVTRRMDRYLKLLASVSSMLVMNHEVIAIMPKRSAAGLTLFIGPEPVPDVADDDGNEYPFDSLHLVTKNPRNQESISGSITLMKIPVVDVGDDIFEFIVRNWDQPFEAHAQAIARLIAACTPGDESWLRLAHYSLFQSAPKAARRFATDIFFELLTTLPTADDVQNIPADIPDLTGIDKEHLRGLFSDDDDLLDRFPLLEKLLDSNDLRFPNSPGLLLQELQGFLVVLLCQAKRNLDALQTLRTQKAPPSVDALTFAVERAQSVVADLHHFVWNSEFFKWYISVYQCQAISRRYVELTRPNNPVPEREEDTLDAEPMLDTQPTVNEDADADADADDENQDNEAEIGDFATDFQTTDELRRSLHPLYGPADKTYSWLRVVTSTFHHTLRFKHTTPGGPLKLDFQVITYPMSDKMLKPWQETVAELASDEQIEKRILDLLRSKADGNRKFAPFRPGGTLKFNGRAHCEAVLGCLHSLAKRRQDISWAGVSQEIVDIFRTTYSIVAPSKRCCPVCATIIAALSRETGAPALQTLSKHTHIFPTAFPCGLPEGIRQQLLVDYKGRLRKALYSLIDEDRTASGLSLQSQALSAGSGDEADSSAKLEEAKRENRVRWVKGWLREPEPRRMERWLKVFRKSPEQWAKYRVELVSQGNVWNGLEVPSYVFDEQKERTDLPA